MTSVLFVCLGNICRSPMAMIMADADARAAGIPATFASAGLSDEEHGGPIDRRAARTLAKHDYPTGREHRAHQLTRAEAREADLVVVMDDRQRDAVRRLAPDADVRLLTDFDPAAAPGTPVPDPWFGDEAGFESTFAQLSAAMPGLLAAID